MHQKKLREDGYFGIYRGEVVDNQDPTNSGRAKVKVYGMYDGVAQQDLPWANPLFPLGGASGYGAVYIPTTGSIVWIMFEAGDSGSPVYLGASPMEGMIPGEIDVPEKYMVVKTPNGSKIYISDGEDEGVKLETPGGNLIELDDVAGRIRLTDKSGSYIEMSDGDIIIQSKGSLYLNPS